MYPSGSRPNLAQARSHPPAAIGGAPGGPEGLAVGPLVRKVPGGCDIHASTQGRRVANILSMRAHQQRRTTRSERVLLS